MPKIYFDTEFTGLFESAGLISIGLIDDSGLRAFYAELTDTYVPEDCSEFCRLEVLPLLEHGNVRMSLAELRAALWAWLAGGGPGSVLICDSRRDVAQLDWLFPQGLPANCSYLVLGGWGNTRRRIFNFGRRLHRKHGLRVHHALDDAKVNRLVLTGKWRQ